MLVCFTRSTDNALTHSVRKISMFSFAESTLTIMAVSLGLTTATEYLMANPAVSPS